MTPSPYAQDIGAACRAFPTVTPAMLRALIRQESQGNPHATRAEPQRQDASVGLVQVLLGTARAHGYTGERGDPAALTGLYAPATNLYYGAAELATRLQQTLGDVPAAFSAYNGGYRPAEGFGARATRPLIVCLQHDADTGKCLRYRRVAIGEYSNQPYVDSVLHFYQQEQAP